MFSSFFFGGELMPYPGGKSVGGIFQRIINEIPPHSIYVEPFLGNGAVMRRKKPAIRSFGIDLDADVFDHWRGHEIDGLELYCCDGIEWLKHFFGLYRVTPDSARQLQLFSVAEFGDPPSHSATSNGDGAEYVDRAFVYADPPYDMDSRRNKRPIYKHQFDEDQHAELLRVLKQLCSFVMVSSYDSALYRSEFSDWRLIQIPTTNRANSPATECLWMNYPPPCELHDYSYLGSDKRERERIRRRIKNWSRGVARLPSLERNAIVDAINRNGANWE